jgi:hypothetical protein
LGMRFLKDLRFRASLELVKKSLDLLKMGEM